MGKKFASSFGMGICAKKEGTNMKNKEKPYLRGEAKIVNENGKVIGYETVAYWNPNYKPWTLKFLQKTEES